MKFVIFVVFSLNLFAYGQKPVCGRTQQAQNAIVKELQGKIGSHINCEMADDLIDYIDSLFVTNTSEFFTTADGEIIPSFQVGDFLGLSDLRRIFFSLCGKPFPQVERDRIKRELPPYTEVSFFFNENCGRVN